MKASTKVVLTSSLIAFTATLSACGKHYRIIDPTSGSTYYSKDYKESRNGGVNFTDSGTDRAVIIQNAEIEKISKGEFKSGIKERDAPKPQPTPEPTPAPAETPASN